MTDLLGQRIRQLRKQRGLTQGQLAKAAGVGRGVVIRIELGRPVHESNFAEVVAKLDTTRAALLQDEAATPHAPRVLTAEEQQLLACWEYVEPEYRGLLLTALWRFVIASPRLTPEQRDAFRLRDEFTRRVGGGPPDQK